MIPYGTFTFFLIAFIVLIPVIILGFLGKRSYIYNGINSNHDCHYIRIR